MATEIYATAQSITEVRTHFVDFTNDLPAAVTVSSAVGTLAAYPTGGTAAVTVGVIASNIVPVTLGTASLAGTYVVLVTATLSSGDASVARLTIPVQWTEPRTGMSDLIEMLRTLTDTGVNDYTVGGIPHWSDKQLQTALDQHRYDVDGETLIHNPRYVAGTLTYKEYRSAHDYLESGTALYIQDSTLTDISSANYSVDYLRGVVTFTSDQRGSTYYLYGRAYNLNAAAADIWRRKAAHYTQSVNFSTDNHRIDLGEIIKNCLEMARHYGQQAASAQPVLYERGDTTGTWYERD